jgi:guanosine-3',5'-bis(diphosphate) 3'-pyrophosphohydrolase
MDQLIKATNFAAIAHANQRRKDANKTPYINHPIEVCNLLASNEVFHVGTLCAALLHDTVEDTNTSLETLTVEFGPIVSEIVALCSDDKSLPKVTRKKLQVEHAMEMRKNPKFVDEVNVHKCALLVKLADKYSNCKNLLTNPPEQWSETEIRGYAIWSYSIVSQLRGLNTGIDSLFDELFDSFEKAWKMPFKLLTKEDMDVMLNLYYEVIGEKSRP